MTHYTIDGGQPGKARLNVIAEMMRPTTASLLAAAGVPAGGHCLDVGCGGGHVSLDLARLVGPTGSVVGIDLDAQILELARSDATAAGVTNVTYRLGAADTLDGGPYDVAYARFLLSHVGDPGGVVTAMTKVVTPGGVVIVEDIDDTACFCYPDSPAYRRSIELYRETVGLRGGNSGIGPALPTRLRTAGLQSIGVNVVQPVALDGPFKLAAYLTLERIATAVVDEGVATHAEVQELLAELLVFIEDPTTLLSVPRIVQSWGFLP
ncbi:MAG: methyltransferase domain-containing protein [Actinomycetota bacterium]|nr:methyltransferase domain-containing protein [Actinomycetota bacterium]